MTHKLRIAISTSEHCRVHNKNPITLVMFTIIHMAVKTPVFTATFTFTI